MSAPQPINVVSANEAPTTAKPASPVQKFFRNMGTSFAMAMSEDAPISEDNVAKLVGMGFNERAARAQLQFCHNNVTQAAEYLVHSAHMDHPERNHTLEEYEAHPECPVCHREADRQHHKHEGFLQRIRSRGAEDHDVIQDLERRGSVSNMLRRESISMKLARMTSRDAMAPRQAHA